MKLTKTISLVFSLALLFIVGMAFSQQAGAQQNFTTFTPKAKPYTRAVTHGFSLRPDLGLPSGDWFLLPGDKGFRFFEQFESTIPQGEINDYFDVSTLKGSLLYESLPKGIDEGALFDDGSIITMSGRQNQMDTIRFYTNKCAPASLWDDEFFIGVGLDVSMNKLTRFAVDPKTGAIIKLVTFHFNGTLVTVEVHRSDVHVHYRNRWANNGLYQNTNDSVFNYKFGPTDSMGGLWTLSFPSSELMQCMQFGWEFQSGGWPGKVYLVPSTVVEMRKTLQGDEQPIDKGPRGLLRKLQGGFPSGAFCEESECDRPVVCPTPIPLDMGMKCEALIKKFPASYWANRNTELPKGGVQIPGFSTEMVNSGTFTALIQSKISEGLLPNATPQQKFNAGWLTFQLNLLANGPSTKSNLDWSKLMCLGVKAGLPANVEVESQVYKVEGVTNMFSLFDLSLRIGRGASSPSQSLLTFSYIFNQINGG